MKIATYNVNGVKSRLPNLLAWLDRERPDIACLQELKALDAAFPVTALANAGYQSLWKGQRSWNGVAILARGMEVVKIRDQLPGEASDDHSRYLEAAVGGVIVCCLYLPNGNPQPGPKFNYKLQWFERLIAHATALYTFSEPVIMAGDYNFVPTDFDMNSAGKCSFVRASSYVPAPCSSPALRALSAARLPSSFATPSTARAKAPHVCELCDGSPPSCRAY